MDDTLKGSDEAARDLGLPVLGLIAHHPAGDELPAAMTEPRSSVAEAFRALRTSIQFAGIDRPIRTLDIPPRPMAIQRKRRQVASFKEVSPLKRGVGSSS